MAKPRKSAKVRKLAVVGLGYVGLPVALLAKKKGWEVVGYDVVQEKVDLINRGKSPIEDVNLERDLAAYPITASTNPSIVHDASVVVVTLPTPVTEEKLPDLKPLISALTAILPHLRKGQVVSIESTINPGVMDEVVIPLLRGRKDIQLDADHGSHQSTLFVVHCPERINPGDKKWTIANIPRVLGGYTQEGVKRALDFYEDVLDAKVKVMNSVTEAEAVKILENAFRDVNIAFVNEMAKSFDKLGIDVKNVIDGAATKPFSFMAHYPGTGVGGHCISVDPYYMIERARRAGFNHDFLKLARLINDGMPAFTVQKLVEGLHEANKDVSKAKVALLGITYKKNVDDIRESPALRLRELIKGEGMTVNVYDPHRLDMSTVRNLEAAVEGADAILLATDHDEFTNALTPQFLASHNIQLVVDGRNALDADGIAQAGIQYYGIGRKRIPKKKLKQAPKSRRQRVASKALVR